MLTIRNYVAARQSYIFGTGRIRLAGCWFSTAYESYQIIIQKKGGHQ